MEWEFVIDADATWQVYATPASPAKRGTVSFQDYWTLSERLLAMGVRGGPALHPLYDAGTLGAKLAGNRSLPVVWAGQGGVADFGAVDVRDRLALVAIPDPGRVDDPVTSTYLAAKAAASNAAAAGAAAVAVYVDVPGALRVSSVWRPKVGLARFVPGMRALVSTLSKSVCVPLRFMR